MKSESIKEITAALAKAQIAFKPIKRTEKVGYDTRGGGSKQYNYAPLEVVIEATKEGLSANGLAVTQTTRMVGGDKPLYWSDIGNNETLNGSIVLETLLSHSSGEWLSGELYVGKQDLAPQMLGSALTYMRRYGYSAILCVSSEEDEDGVIASKNVVPPVPTKKTSVPLTPQQLYKTAQAQKNGADLCVFALEHGWTKEKLSQTLGIKRSADIQDVKAAALVLFPKPIDNTLVEEAERLGAKKIEERRE